jgi:ribosomal protein S18 acetylase RimI-like enzyme
MRYGKEHMQKIEIDEYSDEVHEAINTLLPQLSSSATLLSESELKQIISSQASYLLMAVENGIYFGSLTLAVFKIPTGIRVWIEDVVVSKEARGKGVGRMLTECAIEKATQLGAKTVELTSNPSRAAANALYKKGGFEIRETNVYRYKIT